MGSVVVVHGLSCSWDLPGPGFEPVSPALAGGFLTTAPPGKPLKEIFIKQIKDCRYIGPGAASKVWLSLTLAKMVEFS